MKIISKTHKKESYNLIFNFFFFEKLVILFHIFPSNSFFSIKQYNFSRKVTCLFFKTKTHFQLKKFGVAGKIWKSD